ncbi:MGH1-like glycoside hydrolase domain-containing protein [Sphingobacterium bambusae]|uniref:Glycoside hydrolase n=1 Tax=Sphingobacterium bambusae TaxID=662858 RepID=A0ABW6BD48_9SPHI|nr:glycoside hydrolase [Sphingobacterium bambusae]WPL50646.1 glycoside hydrolase [Sphingobacterium bambusae]
MSIKFLVLVMGLMPFLGWAQTDLDAKLEGYVEQFNRDDNEAVINLVSNDSSAAWMKDNIPLFDCPDAAIEKIYYFRWWSFRKHIKSTPEGTIVTEFIEPVKHAGKYNSISCALGHHLYEGRWLKNSDFLKAYTDFWFYHADEGQSKPRFHQFSSWLADALLAYYQVSGDKDYLLSRLDELDKDYAVWEKERQLPNGLFWQHDVKDGMEESVSGGRKVENMRPTINSYMYGNAKAIASIAAMANRKDLQGKYTKKAQLIQQQLLDSLWDKDDQFFKTRLEKDGLHPAREAIGFIPWYFGVVPDKASYAVAWNQAIDTAGFRAPWGHTTAERREPTFRTRGTGHSCEWDGAIWPFATSQTLRAMANVLSSAKHKGNLSKSDFYHEIQQYAKAHVMNGKPYIGEYQDEQNGEWLKGDHPRSKFYNHSTFADAVIQDLVGFKPALDNSFMLKPLIPDGEWDYFALQDIAYKEKTVSIFWDKKGDRYGKGKGFRVYADGKLVAKSNTLKSLKVKLK